MVKRRGRPSRKEVPKEGAYLAPSLPPATFSSGCTLLDCILGGGWAVGRISNLVGSTASGKSLLAIEASANFLRAYPTGQVAYIETEAAFDKDYANALGLPIDRVIFPNDPDEGSGEIPIDTVEKLFTKILELIDTGEAETLIIVDSLDALSDESEMERGIDAASFGGGKAKKMSELFRRLNQRLAAKNFAVIIISQIRDNLGVVFGKKHTRSGGKALDFYCSQIVWLSDLGKIVRTKSNVKRIVGVKVRARCEKNKIGLPFRDCELPIVFNFGVEDVIAGLEFLEGLGQTEFEYDGQSIEIDKLLRSLDTLEPENYAALREQVNKKVKYTWDEIESTFFIGRKKYNTS